MGGDDYSAATEGTSVLHQGPIQSGLRDFFGLRMDLHQAAAIEGTDVGPAALVEREIPRGDARARNPLLQFNSAVRSVRMHRPEHVSSLCLYGVSMNVARSYIYAIIVVLILAGCRKPGPPYSVDDALKTFKVESGFHIEKFASEPNVENPVAMDVDENGRIYVVEDRGYPLSTDNPLGRVKLLEDTNGDGIPDRVTIFADKLVMPTGVMRWKKGILVTDAPNVWYFEDTDGDGKADIKKLVLTGFAVTNPQHTVNNPIYGLDNWIYLAHEGPATAIIYKKQFGDRGTDIRFPDRPELPALTEHNRNVRFRPDTYQAEALSGSSQYGQAFDDWGHHFTTNNSDHRSEEHT